MHLRYSLQAASCEYNENRHAQTVMKALGIGYQHATPQSMGDQWWFWNCTNIPEKLPRYLSVLEIAPYNAIGFGLSAEQADAIEQKSMLIGEQ